MPAREALPAERKPDQVDGDRRLASRVATEEALMKAALRLLERDGVLSGLNMQEVADEAGVTRSLIHHHFGSRAALLRAALSSTLRAVRPRYQQARRRNPDAKGVHMFKEYVADPSFVRVIAMLALDGDDSFDPIPFAPDRLEDYRREQLEGEFAADVDLAAMLTVFDSTLCGYVLIRKAASRQLGIRLRELDRRVLAMLGRQAASLKQPSPAHE